MRFQVLAWSEADDLQLPYAIQRRRPKRPRCYPRIARSESATRPAPRLSEAVLRACRARTSFGTTLIEAVQRSATQIHRRRGEHRRRAPPRLPRTRAFRIRAAFVRLVP